MLTLLKNKNFYLVALPLAVGLITFFAMQWQGGRKLAQHETEAAIKLATIQTERDQYAVALAGVNEKLAIAEARLAARPAEAQKNKVIFYEKRDSIGHLPFDERFRLFAKRISEGGYSGQ